MRPATWELLELVLAAQCGDAERAAVERWLRDEPTRRTTLRTLTSALDPVPIDSRSETWIRLAPNIRRSRVMGWAGAASAVAAVVLIVVLWTTTSGHPTPGRPDWRIWTTPSGQRASFRLPDGSKVILSVASTLRHPAVFSNTSRDIELEGEAYFEVAPDTRRPFLVRAGDVVVEDMGTQFSMRAYPGDPSPSVVVRAGRVALGLASAPSRAARQVLMPGQLGRLDADKRPIVSQADTAMNFAWIHGWLVFDGIPLREAIPQLQRWFDLQVHLEDSTLGTVPVTAILRDQPTNEMLELLAASLGMEQVKTGRSITFRRSAKRSS